MPGVLHQGIISLFCDDPWLAFDILGIDRPISGPLISRRNEVEFQDRGLGKVKTAFPDLVLVGRDPDDPTQGIVICLEPQAKVDLNKRYRLPFYQAALANRHELPTWVVVVCFTDPVVAALHEWSNGLPPRVDVLILDIASVPMPASLEAAQIRPTATVLAAALHGLRGDLDAARLGIRVCRSLPEDKRVAYTRTILAAVPKPLRKVLIPELTMEEQDSLWEIEQNSVLESIRHDIAIEIGHKRGREEGRQEGRLETLIEMTLALLEVRGVEVDTASESRVRACDDLAMLQRWARRAREVHEVAELFAA